MIAASNEVSSTFGLYDILRNNCQHFIRRLVGKVVTWEADDWDWFFSVSFQPYEYVGSEMARAPGGVATRSIKRLKELRRSARIEDNV